MNILDMLPQQCVLCGDTLYGNTLCGNTLCAESSVGTEPRGQSGICAPCRLDLPWPVQPCRRCGVELGPEPPLHGFCGTCLVEPPAFDRCIALSRYEYPVRELIASFKFNARFAEGQALANLLAEHVFSAYSLQEMPRCLLPVPLHPRRLRERGYNQSVELARTVGRRCAIPVATHYCRRVRSTPPQKGLPAEERALNLRNAFALSDRDSAEHPQHVAIVDDVVTTMATVSAIAHLLRTAGHRRIDVICLARVS